MDHITLRDVSFRFASRKCNSLCNISLKLKQGACLLLAGRSGSGKSTLLHILSGLIPEYYQGELEGDVLVGGTEQHWRDVPLWKKSARVGTVFQDPRHQFFSARVEQELLLSAFSGQEEKKEAERNVDLLLDTLGLQTMGHRLLETLSSGEQQRVAIGTAMNLAPKVLVLDEPSANLSADGIAVLVRFLEAAKAGGTTVVIAEHRFSWLQELVDQVVVLENGGIVYQGTAEKLREQLFCTQFGLRHQVPAKQQDAQKKRTVFSDGPAPLCTMTQVGFRHGKRDGWLLRYLSGKFYSGEVLALTGKNGCGKTTLLSLLFGLYKVGEGLITYTDPQSIRALALQHPDLQLFASTVAEEISKENREQEEWLHRFNLEHLKDCHPLTLSGGEMQRLVLAAAFAGLGEGANHILLLDEPTSGMDGHQLRCLVREIEKLQEQGGSVVMATHDPELLQETGATIMQLG